MVRQSMCINRQNLIHFLGIDAEVAQFFAQSKLISKNPVIDEATNARLRWLIHKRVLVSDNIPLIHQMFNSEYV